MKTKTILAVKTCYGDKILLDDGKIAVQYDKSIDDNEIWFSKKEYDSFFLRCCEKVKLIIEE